MERRSKPPTTLTAKPEDEARYDSSNMGPVTLSVNATREEAMHAVARYALWVRRHIKKAGGGGTVIHGLRRDTRGPGCL
ncbi:MAG: hypothetical protein OEW84_03700 [Aigarchaeota archaeon]|nr:hypothetical protein [Aigarchaeota archaeon]